MGEIDETIEADGGWPGAFVTEPQETRLMPEPRTKKTFGGCIVDHFRAAVPEGTPPALNITISFEDAMRLHLSFGQILGKLNSYNRSTKEGRISAVNLCLYPVKKRITVNEGKLRSAQD